MRILFIHQNFPGQYRHLAPALAAAGQEVTGLRLARSGPAEWQGVKVVTYWPQRSSTPGIHPWVVDIETKVVRAEAALRAMQVMAARGYRPDVVVAHPGWGESLFVKRVWPETTLGLYCEFFYRVHGADWNFDREFQPADPGEDCRIDLKNANNLMQFETADAGLSPTTWQADTFPERFRSRITVCHDGIDTSTVTPDATARLRLPDGRELGRENEVITFVNRNLEPYRGYHTFMRALPEIMARRPKAQVVIVGGSDVSYGRRAPEGTTWKQVFLSEVKDRVDMSRIHYLGRIPYADYLSVLRVSTVHTYLTYPYVLSWSLLEAMSAGCCIVASDTGPVRDVIREGETGRLVDFFDAGALAGAVCGLLAGKASERAALGRRAREAVVSRFDLATICLPGQVDWVLGLARSATTAGEPAAPELETSAPDDVSEVRIAEAIATAETAVSEAATAAPDRKSPAKTKSQPAPSAGAAAARKKKSRSGRQAAR
jgi:glycosyltransferase involved in cell wall biosynthesis